MTNVEALMNGKTIQLYLVDDSPKEILTVADNILANS